MSLSINNSELKISFKLIFSFHCQSMLQHCLQLTHAYTVNLSKKYNKVTNAFQFYLKTIYWSYTK